MAGPLSQDLRHRIAAALSSGESTRSAAKRFGVSVATAVRIGQKLRSGRGLQPGKMGGHCRPASVLVEALCYPFVREVSHGHPKGCLNSMTDFGIPCYRRCRDEHLSDP